jgi:hypothetical protein
LQWEEKIWNALVESAERFSLTRIRLNLYLPHLHEDFYATWQRRAAGTAGTAWRMELPLVANGMTVGYLHVTGDQDSRTASAQLASFLDFIEPLEAQIVELLSIKPVVLKAPGAAAGEPGESASLEPGQTSPQLLTELNQQAASRPEVAPAPGQLRSALEAGMATWSAKRVVGQLEFRALKRSCHRANRVNRAFLARCFARLKGDFRHGWSAAKRIAKLRIWIPDFVAHRANGQCSRGMRGTDCKLGAGPLGGFGKTPRVDRGGRVQVACCLPGSGLFGRG